MRGKLVRIVVVPAALAAAVAAFSPLVAFSADTGSVNAQVQAGVTACITITSPQAGEVVNFGNLAFTASSTIFSEGNGSPDITIQSCQQGASETLLASGTDAQSTVAGSTAHWSLVTSIPANCAPDEYRLALVTNNNPTFLTTSNQTIGTLTPVTGTLTRTPRITMPCTGSSGFGELMSMAYVFTATVP